MTQITMLERVQARIETDIDTDELQRMIDEANAEIIQRHGPHSDPSNPITVTAPGGSQTIYLARPIDTIQDFTITEYWRSSFLGNVTTAVLAADDFKVWFDGRMIERLFTGTNPGWRWGNQQQADTFGWGGSTGWATIAYTPVNDGNQREEVMIKLVRLSLDYETAVRIRMGDVDLFPLVYQQERERLLDSLAPRGLLLR